MILDLSILNASRDNISEYMKKIAMCPCLHMDIMDGIFVPNKTFGPEVVAAYHKASPLSLINTHLMVKDISPIIKDYVDAGSNYIIFHLEIGDTLKHIDEIKSLGAKPGLSIKPATPVEDLIPYLDKVDEILIMSVEPGAGGQTFIKESLDKLKFLKEYKDSHSLHFLINTDGGVNYDTYKSIIPYCDLAVVGSAITKAEDYSKTYFDYFYKFIEGGK